MLVFARKGLTPSPSLTPGGGFRVTLSEAHTKAPVRVFGGGENVAEKLEDLENLCEKLAEVVPDGGYVHIQGDINNAKLYANSETGNTGKAHIPCGAIRVTRVATEEEIEAATKEFETSVITSLKQHMGQTGVEVVDPSKFQLRVGAALAAAAETEAEAETPV